MRETIDDLRGQVPDALRRGLEPDDAATTVERGALPADRIPSAGTIEVAGRLVVQSDIPLSDESVRRLREHGRLGSTEPLD